MKNMKILICIVIGIIILAGIGIGVFVNKNNDIEVAELIPIKVSEVTRSVFYAPQYVAIANGYFAEENLDIEITTGQGADKVMTPVLAGQSDIGFARTRGSNICI